MEKRSDEEYKGIPSTRKKREKKSAEKKYRIVAYNASLTVFSPRRAQMENNAVRINEGSRVSRERNSENVRESFSFSSDPPDLLSSSRASLTTRKARSIEKKLGGHRREKN